MFHRFHALHEQTFGHAAPGTPGGGGGRPGRGLRPPPGAGVVRELPSEAAAPAGTREIRFEVGADAVTAAVYDRAALAAGQVVDGPAVVEQLDTTTLLPRLPRDRPRLRRADRGGREQPDAHADGDPITVAVVASALRAIAWEMSEALRRSSHSPIIREMYDFSCAVFTAGGRDGRPGRADPGLPGHDGLDDAVR